MMILSHEIVTRSRDRPENRSKDSAGGVNGVARCALGFLAGQLKILHGNDSLPPSSSCSSATTTRTLINICILNGNENKWRG